MCCTSSLNSATQLDHELYHPGEDFGADMLGFTDNFAWEALSLAGGNTLDIFDGDTVTTGAGLYIERFLLGDGLSQLSSITSNINIYYLASLLDNAYLGGLNYVLSGGGSLIAIGTAAVPEPSTLLLLGIVLLGFVSVKGAGKLFRTI